MAVCESSQLESGLARLKSDENDDTSQERQLPPGLPLTVDYRSPVSHFVPPAVEMYAARQKQEQVSSAESSETTTPMKRKRGRPRVDKTSPEYLANLAARKQAREMAAMMDREPPTGKRKRGRPRVDKTSPEYLARKRERELAAVDPPTGKRKRGRPRVDKTSPEYIARKREKELEALERKAKKDYKRRGTADSGASSSTGDTTPRVKRKYTKRTPSTKKNDGTPQTEKVKGKRGRPRKDQMQNRQPQPGQIRVRSNLMPINSEPISLDSDEEPDLGSPGASDSLSLDENLRALRHIHEKYANIDKDDMFGAHLLAANFKKPPIDGVVRCDDMPVGGAEGGSRSRREERERERADRVEKLEDSSNSDTDSTSSGSGSSSSGTSSSSSSSGSDSSDSSDSDDDAPKGENDVINGAYPTPAWAAPAPAPGSGSDSEPDPERLAPPAPLSHDELSESDNESPDKSYQCHICRKWYSTRVTLKIHRRSHQSRGVGRARARGTERYECDMCSSTFTRREKLLQHKYEVHRGAMTFRCVVCARSFEHEDELSEHKAHHTQDERDGRCSSCSLSFSSWEQLRRHALSAHSPPRSLSPSHGALSPSHSCSHCGKRFSHVHSLTRHLQNHQKQLYRCVVCKASFARADQLAQHLNSHLDNYKRLKP